MRKFFNSIKYGILGFAMMIGILVLFFGMTLACMYIGPSLNVMLGYSILYWIMVISLATVAVLSSLGIMAYIKLVRRKKALANIIAGKLSK